MLRYSDEGRIRKSVTDRRVLTFKGRCVGMFNRLLESECFRLIRVQFKVPVKICYILPGSARRHIPPQVFRLMWGNMPVFNARYISQVAVEVLIF